MILEFKRKEKDKKKQKESQTNCFSKLKRLELGLTNKIYLFNKYLLSTHYVLDTLRGTVVTVQKKVR